MLKWQGIPRRYQSGILKLGLVAITLFLLFPLLRLALTVSYEPIPQAILTLGGDIDREIFTAQFAQQHPTLPIWVSTGTRADLSQRIFESHGVTSERLHLDYRAVDTVTNFTTLVSDFETLGIHHVYLITTDFHMARAQGIAAIVLGSQGIAFTPVAIPSTRTPESFLHIVRDLARSYLWVITNRSGASVTLFFKPERQRLSPLRTEG